MTSRLKSLISDVEAGRVLLTEEILLAANLGLKWCKLIALAGHWQDGSCETVKLYWDDATKTASIQVGKKSYYQEGGDFAAALKNVPEREDEEAS